MNSRTMLPVVCALLSACGELPPDGIDPQALPSEGRPAAAVDAVRSDRASLRTNTLRAGIDCGTVIRTTDGEYVLSEIKQLEDIQLSGCTFFSGNVRVYFTTPLVPTSQRYLFDLAQVKEVTGAITQHDKGNLVTKQTVLFTGLERAASVVLENQPGCPYQALQTVDTVFVKSAWSCDLPALQTAKDMYVEGGGRLPGFNRLTSLDSLLIDGTLNTISGFAALTQIKQLTLYSSFVGTSKGTFPALTTVGGLRSTNQDLCGLRLPKLTSVTGNVTLVKNHCSLAPLLTVATIDGNLIMQEDVPTGSELHEGPASLTKVGGDFTLKVDPDSITGYNRLQSIGGTLTIETIHTDTLNGFKGLTSLGGLSIKGDGLSVEGFSKLTTVGGSVNIQLESGIFAPTFSALGAVTSIKGSLTISTPRGCSLSKLRTVEGSMWISNRGKYALLDPFPALTTVLGDLETHYGSNGYSALTTVSGSLSVLDVLKESTTGMYSIQGFRSVKTVGKDLILDKQAISFGPNGTQRLLDQLVGFTGRILLR